MHFIRTVLAAAYLLAALFCLVKVYQFSQVLDARSAAIAEAAR